MRGALDMRETPDTRHLVDRRRLLAATSLGIAAAAFVPRSAGAASTADEEANRQTTRDFTKAMETGDWDRVSSLLAEDARFITHAASGEWARKEVEGRTAIMETMESCCFDNTDMTLMITREEALGHVVIHQRDDNWTDAHGSPMSMPNTSMFLVHQGKVQVWFELIGELAA
jgi:limonene-1,2-epoxide hydrolase